MNMNIFHMKMNIGKKLTEKNHQQVTYKSRNFGSTMFDLRMNIEYNVKIEY